MRLPRERFTVRRMMILALGLPVATLLLGPAQAAPPGNMSLMETLSEWKYPGSTMPGGASMSDGGNPRVQSVKCQAILATPDPIEKVIKFYSDRFETPSAPGAPEADARSVATQDDSSGRPVTLRVIVVNRADTATTLVISRASGEKVTHIAWLHYRRLDGKANAEDADPEKKARSDADQVKKAAEWVEALKLDDPAREARLKEVIVTHLKAVRDWHNEHPFTAVPAGINPVTGKPLSNLDRQVIANSAIPGSVHENLMAGLRKDLSPEQVEAILDRYTVGKVAFTMNGYRSIVPNLTREEEATILGFLKQAREEAVDYKNMNQISAIFEIYKTRSEQYLNANGRNWKEMYKSYTDAVKAKKAATTRPKAKPDQ